MKNKHTYILLSLFSMFFIVLALSRKSVNLKNDRAIEDIKRYASSPNVIITVNESKVTGDNRTLFINQLLEIEKIKPHHSSPINKIDVKLCVSSDSIVIDLYQDSEEPTEFWIFGNGEEEKGYREVGRINITDKALLDILLPSLGFAE
ncbi:hypothetical protein [Bernardetia sp.]|uniref:hypothetical protein n=1 Tax=Bernardetia sp. TaxID=1937974 RepID=UPI0025BF7A80|nr:hypothetical protein [Bernardetia sp.]